MVILQIGFPGGAIGKEPTYQCRRPGFDPRAGVGVTVHGVAKSWTHWATNTHTCTTLQIINLHIFLHIRLLLFKKWENVGGLGMVSIFWDSRGQRTWLLHWSWERCRLLQFFLVYLFFLCFPLQCFSICLLDGLFYYPHFFGKWNFWPSNTLFISEKTQTW